MQNDATTATAARTIVLREALKLHTGLSQGSRYTLLCNIDAGTVHIIERGGRKTPLTNADLSERLLRTAKRKLAENEAPNADINTPSMWGTNVPSSYSDG